MKPLFLSGTALVLGVGCVQVSVRRMWPTIKPVGVHVHDPSSRVPGCFQRVSSHDGVSFHGNAASWREGYCVLCFRRQIDR
jgi:hypothetical protein